MGACLRVQLPALRHDTGHVTRALVRRWETQQQPLWHLYQHPLISHTLVRQLSECEDFPTENSKTPHIAVQREGGAVLRGNQQLRWHPSDGEELGTVVMVISWVQVMPDAEVGNLDVVVTGDKAVTSGQVTMDDPLREEEGHSIGHLQDEA